MLYLLIFFGSFLTVIFLAPILIDVLTRLKVVDYPGGRKRHSVPVPRAGGILIYVPLLCSVLIFDTPYSKTLLFSASLIVLCGLKDDICGVRWYNKYFMHSFASSIFIFFFYPGMNQILLFGFQIPYPFDLLILFFFVTGVINSINMLDGLDGLVTGYALLIFTLIFMLSVSQVNSVIMVICSAVTGSLIGFLKFNAFPAKIFLGDTGSMLIGFFLAVSTLILSNSFSKTSLDIAFPVILLGLPIVDMIKVILIRVKSRKSPFLPDRSHIHHKIEDNNIHHKHSVFIIQLFTLGFIDSAVCYLNYSRFIAAALFILLSSVLIFFNRCYRFFLEVREKTASIISLLYPILFTMGMYKKVLLPIAALLIMLIVLLVFPSEINGPEGIIIVMIGVCAMLLASAVFTLKKYRGFHDMYVLLNILIFFILSGSGDSYLPYFRSTDFSSYLLAHLAAAVIIFFAGAFILFREKIFGTRISIFSGLDLIMMVFIVLLISIQSFLQVPGFSFFSLNLLSGFTIYIWFKIFMLIMPGIRSALVIFTFTLQAAMLMNLAF